MVFAIIIGIVLILSILAPFFLGESGALQAASAIQDIDHLRAHKTAILSRFIEDEKAATEELITRLEWKRKKQFLINRYIDIARRMDYLMSRSKLEK